VRHGIVLARRAKNQASVTRTLGAMSWLYMGMDIQVSFPGGRQVDARVGDHVIHTDQSVEHGGAGSAPEPFDVFLGSLATCAGIYVLVFCQARGIPTEGIELLQQHEYSQDGKRLERVRLELTLPPKFPEKYRAAVVNAAAGCKVKKLLLQPPEVSVTLKVDAANQTQPLV
jgi:ribosomal protein S12 methylthiotransferase accessory factor